jgi:hypothetical protein
MKNSSTILKYIRLQFGHTYFGASKKHLAKKSVKSSAQCITFVLLLRTIMMKMNFSFLIGSIIDLTKMFFFFLWLLKYYYKGILL